MTHILVSGSIAYDRIMGFPGRFKEHILPDRLDHLSVSFTVDTFAEGFGGTAGNIAYNLALLGLQPTIVATAGNDFGIYASWLATNGIDDASIVIAPDVPTASAYMISDAGDNQIAAFYLGAMVKPYERTIEPHADALAIIAPGNNVDMAAFAKHYRERGIRYLFDPGQQAIMLSKEDLRAGIAGATVLFANEYEMGILEERTGWSRSEIASKVQTVIITLAEKGSTILSGAVVTTIPAVPVVAAVDPTGAGDAYRAGYILGLTKAWSVEECVRLASTVAAYAVQMKGTQNHSFTPAELAARFSQAYGHELSL